MSRWQKLCAVAAICAGSALVATPLAGASTLSLSRRASSDHAHKATNTKAKKKKVAEAPLALSLENSKFGPVLASGTGMTLYETTGNCTSSSCLAVWPPATVSGRYRLGKGVKSALVKEVRIGKSSEQLSYAGHRLYYFVRDTKAHEYNGEGINSPWGLWHAVSGANGKAALAPSTKKATTTATVSKKKSSTSKGW